MRSQWCLSGDYADLFNNQLKSLEEATVPKHTQCVWVVGVCKKKKKKKKKNRKKVHKDKQNIQSLQIMLNSILQAN